MKIPDTAPDKRLQWWTQSRFGMFIHWGLYAQFLHDASELRFGKPLANVTWQEELAGHDLLLDLPVTRPDCEIPVIELFLHD